MKPDWKDAPEWAKWVAMDGDGFWNWYEVRPYFDQLRAEWWLRWPNNFQLASDAPDESGIDWDHAWDTLERRP